MALPWGQDDDEDQDDEDHKISGPDGGTAGAPGGALKPMHPTLKAQLQLHCCVLLWGFTAILGKLISLPALGLVWWRMLLVVLLLAPLPRLWRALRAMPARLMAVYAGIGGLVALHWLSFYGAIKLANASVAATCLGLAPAMLAVVEPWIAGRRFEPRELLLGAAVVPGVALVVGGIPGHMHEGVAVGALSALFVAIFGSLNKRYVEHADPLLVTGLELAGGALFLTLLAPLLVLAGWAPAQPFAAPGARDAGLLVLLALGCTLLPFTLSLVALRRLSAFSAQLAVNLEPVYAIVLAMLLLGEQRELDRAFYGGVAIIIASVLLAPLLRRRERVAPVDLLPATLSQAAQEADRR